ncbi:SsgA family sporulation/cell division regulator [Streptomyces sp. NPDC060322]|uniref:SsgA family sporulation/cell division regulator n=1 Tax=Streptomyces sp. NPDC060322 TaxID=3347097 RepID=UPI0036668029
MDPFPYQPTGRHPSQEPLVIQTQTRALLFPQDYGRLTFPATALYDSSDPYAVQIRFPTLDPRHPATSWTFARELLAKGLDTCAGEGDVHLCPHDAWWTRLRLRGRTGTALLLLERTPLQRFVDDIYHWVPQGQEHGLLRLDEVLAQILGEAS